MQLSHLEERRDGDIKPGDGSEASERGNEGNDQQGRDGRSPRQVAEAARRAPAQRAQHAQHAQLEHALGAWHPHLGHPTPCSQDPEDRHSFSCFPLCVVFQHLSYLKNKGGLNIKELMLSYGSWDTMLDKQKLK